MIATGIGHAGNLLFQVLMGRMLGGNQMDQYGIMNTMLSIFGLFAIPSTALQLAIARQTAILESRGQHDGIAPMLRRAARRLAMWTTGLTVLLLALSPWLKSFLKLEHYAPILVTVGLIAVTVMLPVTNGAIQGLKRFGWLSGFGVLSPMVRIVGGAGLVWLGWKAGGALMGTLAANAAVLVLSAVALKGHFSRGEPSSAVDTRVVYQYIGPTLLSLIAYAVLVNLDLIVVKHYFTAEETAQYSAATLFGRAIGWLIAPLCTVLFPHVWDDSQHQANRSLLLKFLLVAIGMAVAGALVCSLARDFLPRMLLGRTDDKVSALIPIAVWAMLPIGVANVFLNFVMARGRYGFLAVFVGIAVLYLVAFALWHDTVRHVLTVVAIFGVATLGMFVAITRGKR